MPSASLPALQACATRATCATRRVRRTATPRAGPHAWCAASVPRSSHWRSAAGCAASGWRARAPTPAVREGVGRPPRQNLGSTHCCCSDPHTHRFQRPHPTRRNRHRQERQGRCKWPGRAPVVGWRGGWWCKTRLRGRGQGMRSPWHAGTDIATLPLVLVPLLPLGRNTRFGRAARAASSYRNPEPLACMAIHMVASRAASRVPLQAATRASGRAARAAATCGASTATTHASTGGATRPPAPRRRAWGPNPGAARAGAGRPGQGGRDREGGWRIPHTDQPSFSCPPGPKG